MLRDDDGQLPERLRLCRLELGWTEEDEARALGATRSTVANYEATTSRRRNPDLGVLMLLARWHGKSLDWLLGVPGAEPDSPGVRLGRNAVRQRLPEEMRSQPNLTTAARMRLALSILQEVAPEAWFSQRVAAHLLVTEDRLLLMIQDNYDLPDAVLERFARLLDIPLRWFFIRPQDIGEP